MFHQINPFLIFKTTKATDHMWYKICNWSELKLKMARVPSRQWKSCSELAFRAFVGICIVKNFFLFLDGLWGPQSVLDCFAFFFLFSLYSHHLQHKLPKVPHLLAQSRTITEFTTT